MIGDGARGDIIRWSTHGPRGDIMDMYTTLSWQSRCEETAKLRITLAAPPAPEPPTPPPTVRPQDALQLFANHPSSSAIALRNPVDEADDLLQILLHEVATAVALQQKSPESYGLGAHLALRGGRDLKAENRYNSEHIEVQRSGFTTTQQFENANEGQETGSACSDVVNSILPSVSALDPMAKALWVVLVRWTASGDLQELRRALFRVLAELT